MEAKEQSVWAKRTCKMEINLGKGWVVAEQNVVCDEEKGREQ